MFNGPLEAMMLCPELNAAPECAQSIAQLSTMYLVVLTGVTTKLVPLSWLTNMLPLRSMFETGTATVLEMTPDNRVDGTREYLPVTGSNTALSVPTGKAPR